MLSTKCVYKEYIYYMYKKDLALNDLQWLICHKTKPNQSNLFSLETKETFFSVILYFFFLSFFLSLDSLLFNFYLFLATSYLPIFFLLSLLQSSFCLLFLFFFLSFFHLTYFVFFIFLPSFSQSLSFCLFFFLLTCFSSFSLFLRTSFLPPFLYFILFFFKQLTSFFLSFSPRLSSLFFLLSFSQILSCAVFLSIFLSLNTLLFFSLGAPFLPSFFLSTHFFLD